MFDRLYVFDFYYIGGNAMTLYEILINYENDKYTYKGPLLRLIDSTYILDKTFLLKKIENWLKNIMNKLCWRMIKLEIFELSEKWNWKKIA